MNDDTTPIKQESSKIIKYGGGFLVGCILLCIIGPFIIPNKDETPENPKKKISIQSKDIMASIVIEKGILSVTNDSDFKWKPSDTIYGYGIIFIINDDFVYVHPGEIKRKDTLAQWLTNFADKKGVRFNMLLFKPQIIRIICNEGSKTYYF